MFLSKHICYGAILLLSVFQTAAAECEINPVTARAPLILNGRNTSILYPKAGEKTIKIANGQVVEFACPQKTVIVDGTHTQAVVEATCISDQRFTINGQGYLWSQIYCSADPVPVGRLTNSNCGSNARLAEIGFDLGKNRFLRTIAICFDTKQQTTLYSYYDLPASIDCHDSSTSRPKFVEDDGFYNIGTNNVNGLYVLNRQKQTINALLGLPAGSTEYVKGGQYMLSRGHLTAKADFIYGSLQKTTFRYINAAPQWETFNGNNWNKAEMSTRNYAVSRKVDLQVWTGTYGIATLPHKGNGQDIPLSLYVDGETRALPVPAIYWKIVFDPTTRRGIVLIGLNNPYETDVKKHVICPDVSSQVNWLSWHKENILQGYSYACTVASFRKVVAYAPNLSVSGLLV